MSLPAGTRLGPYEVIAAIGSGGMGEVYRARDTRLGREVAIKILGSRHAINPERRERFQQEARTTSALNHPNIVALYDIGSENGADFLVMELVRGKTLDHIGGNRGLAIAEAVKYAIPIADALARAHNAGILHRDLKPSNLMVTEDGVPKILDFGLAQLSEPESVSEADATRTLEKGQIAGTPGYMSPEQAEGKKLDARTDIFSFGAVLYEMVTGRRAFRGDSAASTLAAVLRQEPEAPSRVTPNVPHELERIIQRCLRKDPSRRFHSMSDVKVELEEVREETESGVQAVPVVPRSRRRWLWAAAGAAAVVVIGLVAFRMRQGTTAPPPSVPIPLTAYRGDEYEPDFSPDGSQVVFAWNGEHATGPHIYVKLVGSPSHLQLTKGDASDTHPAWSPDGRWIAFHRTGSLTMLVSPLGGPERRVGDKPCSIGPMAWSNDSQWLACSAFSDRPGVLLVRAESGEVRRLTTVTRPQVDKDPAFSPDGRSLLFARCAAGQFNCDLELLELNADLSPRGQPRPITDEHGGLSNGVTWTSDGSEAIWSTTKASMYSSTLYRVSVLRPRPPQLLSFAGRAAFPVMARHRNRLTYSQFANDIHVWFADGHTLKRHPVSSTQIEFNARFSPNGRRIAFEAERSGPEEIWVANADGSQPVQLTTFGRHSGSPDWSPDGRWIVFDSYSVEGRWDLWAVDAAGGTPRQIRKGPGDSNVPSFSHDGKWIYFYSNRTGRSEIFRTPFAGGAEIQVTHNGGSNPLESDDGKTVYYLKSGGLWQAPAGGGEERPVGITVIAREWNVASDGVYFVAGTGEADYRAYEIRFFDFLTHRQRTIQSLGEVRLPGWALSVSPDRKTFLYSVEEGTGADLMLVENFR